MCVCVCLSLFLEEGRSGTDSSCYDRSSRTGASVATWSLSLSIYIYICVCVCVERFLHCTSDPLMLAGPPVDILLKTFDLVTILRVEREKGKNVVFKTLKGAKLTKLI